MELTSQRNRFSPVVTLSQTHVFLLYMTFYLTHYQIHYLNSLIEYGQSYNPWIKRVYFEKSFFEILKRLAFTLNTAA